MDKPDLKIMHNEKTLYTIFKQVLPTGKNFPTSSTTSNH